MAVTVSELARIEQVLIKVGENGFVVQFEGETENKDWYNVPLIAHTISEVADLLEEKLKNVSNIPK